VLPVLIDGTGWSVELCSVADWLELAANSIAPLPVCRLVIAICSELTVSTVGGCNQTAARRRH